MSEMFSGERMTCVVCGKERGGNGDGASAWRAVVWDGERFYACPGEFPGDEAPAVAFKQAFVIVIIACVWARLGQPVYERGRKWCGSLRRG